VNSTRLSFISFNLFYHLLFLVLYKKDAASETQEFVSFLFIHGIKSGWNSNLCSVCFPRKQRRKALFGLGSEETVNSTRLSFIQSLCSFFVYSSIKKDATSETQEFVSFFSHFVFSETKQN
jgi:hypothetical protein